MDIDSVISGEPDSLRLPLLGLCKFGLFSKNKFRKYLRVGMFSLFVIYFTVVAILQFTNINKDISEFVQNLEVILSFVKVFAIIILLMYQEDTFLKLIKTTKIFKAYEEATKQRKQNTDHDEDLRCLIVRMEKTFLFATLACLILMITRSLTERIPAAGIWTLEEYDVLRRFTFIEIAVILPPAACLCWVSSSVYLGFCTEIIIQFRILCRNLRKIGKEITSVTGMEQNYLNQFKICLQHHELILEFLKDFQQAFSLLLLLVYFVDCPLCCLELLAASEGSTLESKIRHAVSFLVLILQLCFYCIPANYIENQALAVADAVYFSKWYIRCHPSFKQPVMLMIRNAQVGIIIKAGGIVTINANTVVNILKVGWSTCSLIKGAKQN